MFNKLTAIIRKDTTLRFEGRAELLFFLILPLIFTFLIGGGLPAAGGGGDNRLLMPVVDEDGSARSAALLTALAAGDVARPEAMSRAEAEALLADEDAAAALIIPAGFGAALSADGRRAGRPKATGDQPQAEGQHQRPGDDERHRRPIAEEDVDVFPHDGEYLVHGRFSRRRNHRFHRFHRFRKKKSVVAFLISQAAAGQVEEDRFEVRLFDVDGADVKTDGVGAADDDG